jgi:glycosyltransferase involved in cell wall biosynthesis
MVLLEAFAEGTPVIVPDLPSMATFVNHQREGLIYSAGHPSALADALTEILTATESVWSNWSRYTREAYTQYYGEATNYQQLISIYRSVIEDRRSVLSHASQTDSNVAHKPAVPFEVSQS